MWADFQLSGLYAALDELRRERGLSWAQVTREVSRVFEHTTSRPIAQSTITSLRSKHVAEADGVLQMLRWLDRTPESFVPDLPDDAGQPLPRALPHQVIRMDTRLLHAALNTRRAARGLTWEGLVREMRESAHRLHPTTVSSLTNLSRGGRTGFPHVMRITRWLGRPLADFTRLTRR